MLTSLYYPKEILKSLLSGVPTSLPGGFNSCSFFMGLIRKWADHVNLPVAVISEAFGVPPQAVYGNINRLAKEHTFKELAECYKLESAVAKEKNHGANGPSISRLFRDFSMKADAMGLPEEVFRLLYSRLSVNKESEAYAELTRQGS